MATEKCPNCNKVLSDPRARFCDQCGSPIQRSEPGKAMSEGANHGVRGVTEKPLESEEPRSDEKPPLGAVGVPPDLAELSGMKASEIAQQRQESIRSQGRVRKDGLEERLPQTASHGIALSVNTNQFYMEGFSGVIDTKVQNLGSQPYDSFKMEVSSNLLSQSGCSSFRLGAGEGKRRRFRIEPPASGGIELVQFDISARQGDSVYVYRAETTLIVLPRVEDAKDIRIQAENLVNLGQASEKFNIGGVIDLHIDDMIKQNKIKTAYDFMMEYGKLRPDFEALEIEFDPERSEQLTKSLASKAHLAGPGKSLLHPQKGSLTNVASLQMQSQGRTRSIVLIAKLKVTIGRSRTNDIVARVLPRSGPNDVESFKISTTAQCQLALTERGVYLRDNHSANGTLLDSQEVGSKARLVSSDIKQLKLGGVLTLAVRHSRHETGYLDPNLYGDVVSEPLGRIWDTAGRAGLDALCLSRTDNLGPDDVNGFESYALIYRMASIGSNPECTICSTDKGLRPMHAGILHLRDRFYVENFCDSADVVVNDVTLSMGQLMPLGFGDRIRIARLDMKFLQRSQLFVDPLQTS